MESLKILLLNFAIPCTIVGILFFLFLKFLLPRPVNVVYNRELKSYFVSPVAYVLFIVFSAISGILTFFFLGILEAGEADLFLPYFQYLPWYLILIAPAVGMRLWSEEQRLGTMELILTMPMLTWHAILGKFLAASTVIFSMLVLSFPIVWTINYLGEPDNGVILSGFISTFLVALSFLSVTSFISAITRSQLVALLISFFICLVLWLSGLPNVNEILINMRGLSLIFWPFLKIINEMGIMPHFIELAKGVLNFRDLVFFLSFITFFFFATSVALRLRRA